MMKPYLLVFNNSYNFNESSISLERVLLRIDRFIFMLINDDKILPLILADNITPFYNLKHITINDFDYNVNDYQFFARFRYRRHFAIPFTIKAEPSPIYKVLDDNTIFIINAIAKQSNYHISKYLSKHDRLRTSIFYAYNDIIKHKLQSKHFLADIIVASNDKSSIDRIASVLKDLRYKYVKNVSLDKPKKPLLDKSYTLLSHIELLSLMLPDDINIRLEVDGVRPYTNSYML